MYETELTRTGRADYLAALSEERDPRPDTRSLYRATFARGGDLFTWWTVKAENLTHAVQVARRISAQMPSLGALFEVVQEEEQ